MESDIIDHPVIDPNIKSYEQFFDREWCERIFKMVNHSPLQSAVYSLMIAWRSTNGSHLLPWLMVQSLARFAKGEYTGNLQNRADYSGKIVKGIVGKLENRMNHSLNRDQRGALKRVVIKLEAEAFQSLRAAEAEFKFDLTGYWDFLINSPEFAFCILGTQRINYASLFFAYEDFLANVIRTKDSAYTSKGNSFKVAILKHFDAPLTDFCWNHDEVNLAMFIRHALVHNGGRFGDDLEKYKARFVDATGTNAPVLRGDLFNVVDGKIQIAPCNSTHLFGVLKDRVTKIVEQIA